MVFQTMDPSTTSQSSQSLALWGQHIMFLYNTITITKFTTFVTFIYIKYTPLILLLQLKWHFLMNMQQIIYGTFIELAYNWCIFTLTTVADNLIQVLFFVTFINRFSSYKTFHRFLNCG